MPKELLKIRLLVSKHRFAILLILFGSLSWILTMVKNGLMYSFGLGFWGPHGHDAVWHIALAEALSRGSLENPIFAGQSLQNYHIGFDLLLAVLYKVTMIPISVWYFQLLPVIFSVSIGYLTYRFIHISTKNATAAWWSTFFIYFGGSLGWVVTLLRGQGVGGESVFWSQQAISTLINPPFALSLIILLGALILLQSRRQRVVTIVLFSLLLSIKSYAGVLALGGLFVLGLYEYLRSKDKYAFTIFFFSLGGSLLLFLPLNKSAGGLIEFHPFWFLETMLAISDRFSWPKLYEAIINWKSGGIYGKAIIGYIVAFVLFLIGNIGTRIISVGSLFLSKTSRQSDNQYGSLTIFLWMVILGGIIFPMLFVQEGTPWNTIQFFYYSLFALALLSGVGISTLLKKSSQKTKFAVGVVLVLLTTPTTVSTLVLHYLPSRPPARVPTEEVEALRFLSREPVGIVLTYPFDPIRAKEAEQNPPRPLALYESTAYVSAFSKKPVFLEDEVNLNILGYDWKSRRAEVEAFYKSNSQDFVRDFLKQQKIQYIYWRKGERAVLGETQLGLTRIFENKEIDIYRVD